MFVLIKLVILEEHIQPMEIECQYGARDELVMTQGKRYPEKGEEALKSRKENPYAALYTGKSLSEVGRLQLAIKLQGFTQRPESAATNRPERKAFCLPMRVKGAGTPPRHSSLWF